MKNILEILSLAALLSAHSAFAITPENGWWWNPQESGMGFNIESQNGTVFIATFVYDNSGNPIWYSGSGQIDANNTVTANLQISQNGACFTCAYQAPTTTDAGIPLVINFTSQGEGTLSWQGKQVAIERFNFNLGTAANGLLGEWVFMPNVPSDFGEYVGDRIIFNRIEENGNVSGARVNMAYKTAIAGPMDPKFGYKYAAVIDSNSSLLSNVYVFNFASLNKITGLTAQSLSSASPATMLNDVGKKGVPFEGYRIIR
jgi:hypothetical protein